MAPSNAGCLSLLTSRLSLRPKHITSRAPQLFIWQSQPCRLCQPRPLLLSCCLSTERPGGCGTGESPCQVLDRAGPDLRGMPALHMQCNAMHCSGLTGCSCNVRQLHERRAAAGVVGSCAGWFFVCLMIWLSCIKLRIYSRTWRLGRRCCAFTTQITVLPWSGWSAH